MIYTPLLFGKLIKNYKDTKKKEILKFYLIVELVGQSFLHNLPHYLNYNQENNAIVKL